MIGTAPPQSRWLLLEHPGPWSVTAPFDSGLPTPLLRELGHPDRRVVLIRRPGRRAEPGPSRRWFRREDGVLRTGWWSRPDELPTVLEPDAGAVVEGPLLAVCTHGVHDVCCAVRGRPVAAALADRWPDQSWECSHLGGDRFAASLMIFPDLTCYGGLGGADGADAVRLVDEHRAGRVQAGPLRGVAGLPPAAQTAVAAAQVRWGPAPAGALTLISCVPVGTTTEGRSDASDAHWRVVLAGEVPFPSRIEVEVASRRRPAHRLTCRATRETSALEWRVISVG